MMNRVIMPKVSVILTSYNHAKYISHSIESVLQQTYTDFELIIGDDASTDESWSIINTYRDPRIRAFRNDINSAGQQLNTAIETLAQGEYIAVHHSDDIWESNKLTWQVDFLESHSEFGAVFTDALAIDEDGDPLINSTHAYSNIFSQPNRTRHQWLNFFFCRGNALCHPSVLIRKECYNHCGLYRNGLGLLPDFDMWVRLCLKHEIYVLPEKLVRFRVRTDEANTSGNRPEVRIRGSVEYFVILKRFLSVSSFEELATIFPEAEKYYRTDGFNLKYVLGMVALEKRPFSFTELFGIQLLFELLEDPVQAGRIKSIYDFDYQDLIRITGQCDVFRVETLIQYNAQIESLMQAVTDRDQQLQDLSQAVTDRDQQLQDLSQAVTDRDQQLQDLSRAVTDRDQQLQDLSQAVTDRDQQLRSLLHSLTWRATAPLRALFGFCLRLTGNTSRG
jgi:glycosyltransferase involved in cell wall biosynthesis